MRLFCLLKRGNHRKQFFVGSCLVSQNRKSAGMPLQTASAIVCISHERWRKRTRFLVKAGLGCAAPLTCISSRQTGDHMNPPGKQLSKPTSWSRCRVSLGRSTVRYMYTAAALRCSRLGSRSPRMSRQGLYGISGLLGWTVHRSTCCANGLSVSSLAKLLSGVCGSIVGHQVWLSVAERRGNEQVPHIHTPCQKHVSCLSIHAAHLTYWRHAIPVTA